MYPLPAGGRAGGGHALSREVDPPEDRGAAPGAAGVPDRHLGASPRTHRPRGVELLDVSRRRRAGRLPASRTPSAPPAGTPPDPRLPRRPPGLGRPAPPAPRSRPPPTRPSPRSAATPRTRTCATSWTGDGAPHRRPRRLRRHRRAAPQRRGAHRRPRQALDLYNGLVDPCHAPARDALHVVDNVGLDKQAARSSASPAPARLLSREDALLGSALVAGRLSAAELRDVSDLVAQRTLLYEHQPAAAAGRRTRPLRAASGRTPPPPPLRTAEEAALAAGAGDAPRRHRQELGHRRRQRPGATSAPSTTTRPTATRTGSTRSLRTSSPRRSSPASLGLIALLVSLFLSVRVGRALIRDLKQLRTGGPRGVRRAAAQRHAPPRRGRAGRRGDRGAAPGVRQERDRRGRPGPQHAAAGRRRGRRQAGRTARAVSPRSSSTSPAAARCCCTGSSRCWTPWSAAPRTPRNSPTCSASTT